MQFFFKKQPIADYPTLNADNNHEDSFRKCVHKLKYQFPNSWPHRKVVSRVKDELEKLDGPSEWATSQYRNAEMKLIRRKHETFNVISSIGWLFADKKKKSIITRKFTVKIVYTQRRNCASQTLARTRPKKAALSNEIRNIRNKPRISKNWAVSDSNLRPSKIGSHALTTQPRMLKIPKN